MKYALVTGGSRGIGRAICTRLAEMGYNILINYSSNKEAAEETLSLVSQIGKEGEVGGELLCFDVCKGEEVIKSINQWQDAHPEDYIEVCVNNAGIRKDNLMALMTDEEWDSVLHTSLYGFYNVTRPLLRPMMSHKYGRIISMASLSGLKGLLGQVNYSAAKGGMIAATKALAQEVARYGITANCIAPGFIKTDMTKGLDEASLKKTIPANRFGTAEEVAECVAFLASEKAGYITGNVISINGGLYT